MVLLDFVLLFVSKFQYLIDKDFTQPNPFELKRFNKRLNCVDFAQFFCFEQYAQRSRHRQSDPLGVTSAQPFINR